MIKILFASRLVYEKWVDILINCIETYAQDRELQNDIEWHICSDGEWKEQIIELTKKYKNITYYGRLNSEKMQELYRWVDILFMPSRFLETFWLTALEALSLGTPVCAPAKWWLSPFVTNQLRLDESNAVQSFRNILIKRIRWSQWELPDIQNFWQESWNQKLSQLFETSKRIMIIHDYKEKIGWAEYYISHANESLQNIGKDIYFYGYTWHTTVWKRRIMFILSIFAFWRGIGLYRVLAKWNIDTIWMHSILRYIGPWWVLAIRIYTKKNKVYISHHDIWLLAAFPQDITQESAIPLSSNLLDFIPKAGVFRKTVSIWKFLYIKVIKILLPKDTIHITFADFLERNIKGQFGEATKIELFPHMTIVKK